jgi:hypothetical protein
MRPPHIKGGNSVAHNYSVFNDLSAESRMIPCRSARFQDHATSWVFNLSNSQPLISCERSPAFSQHHAARGAYRVTKTGYAEISPSITRANIPT